MFLLKRLLKEISYTVKNLDFRLHIKEALACKGHRRLVQYRDQRKNAWTCIMSAAKFRRVSATSVKTGSSGWPDRVVRAQLPVAPSVCKRRKKIFLPKAALRKSLKREKVVPSPIQASFPPNNKQPFPSPSLILHPGLLVLDSHSRSFAVTESISGLPLVSIC